MSVHAPVTAATVSASVATATVSASVATAPSSRFGLLTSDAHPAQRKRAAQRPPLSWLRHCDVSRGRAANAVGVDAAKHSQWYRKATVTGQ